MIGKLITAKLKADAAVVALVANEIYPLTSKPETLPAIYYGIKAMPQYDKQGTGIVDWQLVLITFCNNYDQAWDLAIAIKSAIELVNGASYTYGNMKMFISRCETIEDDYEFNEDTYGHKIIFKIKATKITT